jgi:hypothetical protein
LTAQLLYERRAAEETVLRSASLTGVNDVFLGACAGWGVTTGQLDLLIGESTTTPTPTTSRFENLFNVFCRQDGQPVACPPPVPVESCDPATVVR